VRGLLARRLYSVAEVRRLARRALPRSLCDFVDGGAEDEVTLRRNEAAFAQVALLPTPLSGSTVRDQRLTLFGREIAMPLIVGPTGLSGLLWPDGELATARAAAAAGIPYCLSHGSTCTIEALAATGAVPRWMQVFTFKDRGLTRSFTERARAAGYDALVLTTDNQALGNRERDIRNGFSIPPRLPASPTASATARPARSRRWPRPARCRAGCRCSPSRIVG
jgi:L-lactate dehydrogenase (cytochrome)/(S)-mandelate dehydrogenase